MSKDDEVSELDGLSTVAEAEAADEDEDVVGMGMGS
jgi:hypothetical protein